MPLHNHLAYFVIGGGATLLGELIVERYDHGIALSSYLYGAVPTIYIMLLWFAYVKSGKKGYDTFIAHSLINCGMFYIVLLILFGLSSLTSRKGKDFNISIQFLIAVLTFAAMSALYFHFFFHKVFLF